MKKNDEKKNKGRVYADAAEVARRRVLNDAPSTCPFKRHKGKPWDKIPRPYLEWMLTLPDLRPATRAAVREELARRGRRGGRRG